VKRKGGKKGALAPVNALLTSKEEEGKKKRKKSFAPRWDLLPSREKEFHTSTSFLRGREGKGGKKRKKNLSGIDKEERGRIREDARLFFCLALFSSASAESKGTFLIPKFHALEEENENPPPQPSREL